MARALGPGVLAASVAWLGLASSSAAVLAEQGATPPREVPMIYQKQKSFRIPFNLSAAQKTRIKEVILLVSQDSGDSWNPVSRTDAGHPAFSFRASHDGEYWFAVQTQTTDGKVSPMLDSYVEPKMKVVIDTVPPSLVLERDRRRGSTASVRWEVKDEYLDPRSLSLEYQVEGVGVWNRVPIARPKLIGSRTWDAGTAEALKVRMSVADLAGNVTSGVLNLPDGTGGPPEADPGPGAVEDAGPPRIETLAGAGMPQPRITAGAGFTPVDEEPPPIQPAAPSRAAQPRPRSPATAKGRARPSPPDWDRDPGLPPAGPAAASATFAASTSGPDRSPANAGQDPFPAANPAPAPDGGGSGMVRADTGAAQAVGAPSASARPAANQGGAGSAANTLLVDNPRFKLQYAVDDAGPNGPATIELWITQDGGRTWIRRGEDPDRTSPIDVDLGGEGTYGICLVAKSAAGLGDQPPAPGDPPQTWVEVDASPPAVQLDPVQVGTGANSGKIAITWRATDLHLAPKSVSLYWRPDQPGAAWQPMIPGQENAGRYIWVVPQSVPPRFHVRVEAVDTVGHRGFAESTESGPIMVDRSRPRTRIIGLDPNARSGLGPSAWPLR
jgi:hypothetical protein